MMVRVLKQARLLQYLLPFWAHGIDAELYVHSMGRLALLCRKELWCNCRVTVANVEGIVNNGCKIHVMKKLCSMFSWLLTVWGQISYSFVCVFLGFNVKLT